MGVGITYHDAGNYGKYVAQDPFVAGWRESEVHAVDDHSLIRAAGGFA